MIMRLQLVEITNDNNNLEKMIKMFTVENIRDTCMVSFVWPYAIKHSLFYKRRLVRAQKMLLESESKRCRVYKQRMRASCVVLLADV